MEKIVLFLLQHSFCKIPQRPLFNKGPGEFLRRLFILNKGYRDSLKDLTTPKDPAPPFHQGVFSETVSNHMNFMASALRRLRKVISKAFGSAAALRKKLVSDVKNLHNAFLPFFLLLGNIFFVQQFMSIDKVRIRNFESSDIVSLSAEKEAWKLKGDGRQWLEWFLEFRPDSRLFLVATLGEKIIGYYANIASSLKIEDKVVQNYRGTIVTHPNYRKKSSNALRPLLRSFHARLEEKKSVVSCFPIQPLIRYFTRKLRIRILKRVSRYLRVLKITYLLERFVKHERLAQILSFFLQPFLDLFYFKDRFWSHEKIAIREIHSFDERFDSLWERASRAYRVLLVRDQEYLNWRYVREPGQKYVIFAAEREKEVLGYVVLKQVEKNNRPCGIIFDLFGVRNREVLRALVLGAVEYFKKQGLDKVEFYLSDDYYESILKSLGFLKRKIDPGRSGWLLAKSYRADVEHDFYNPKHWFVTSSDMIMA
jgi:hypothetical protein